MLWGAAVSCNMNQRSLWSTVLNRQTKTLRKKDSVFSFFTASKINLNIIHLLLLMWFLTPAFHKEIQHFSPYYLWKSLWEETSLFFVPKCNKGQLNPIGYIQSHCLILHLAVISFPYCVSKLNIFSSIQKYCLVWDLRQTLLSQDICSAQISLPSVLSPCKVFCLWNLP